MAAVERPESELDGPVIQLLLRAAAATLHEAEEMPVDAA